MLGLIGSILLLGDIVLVANWLAEKGVVDWARYVRAEYLTGTAVTIIVVWLILLVSPKAGARGLVRRCPVCDHVLVDRGRYCGECGSKVQPLVALRAPTLSMTRGAIRMNEAGQQPNRREFLKQATQAAALAVGVTNPRSLLAAGESKASAAIQIGILLGTFRSDTLESRLDAVKACGLDSVQVSLDCAGMPDMPDEIPPELSSRIRHEAAARGITIASLQGTFNMSHPDPEQRRTGLRRLRVLAEACPQLGASKIHLCTGTRDRSNMWRRHPDNDSPEAWRDMVACVREATEIARQTRVVLAFEPEVNNVVDSAQKARRLLNEIASPHLRVTIDPANLFHAGELPRMPEILDEAFALVGKDIVLAHAKDLDHDGDAGHLAAGQGKLDYDHYLSLLHAHQFHGALLLHGLSVAQVPDCVAFLRQKLAGLPSVPSGR